MEYINQNTIDKSLTLKKVVFNVLFDKIKQQFINTHTIENPIKNTQLFGFGNYNPNKPNLKKDFEVILKGYVNGKYLYNKTREALDGKPVINISREYQYIFLNYIGCKDINEFLSQNHLTPNEKIQQIEILNHDNTIEDHYYVCYYYGEDKKLNKGQVIISKQWKSIEMAYIYEHKHSKTSVYSFFGNITYSEGFAFIDTKFYKNNKKNEGARYIFFVGKSSPHERNYLIGTYSGFDKYDNTIAGKMILKKFHNKEKMEDEVLNKIFNPIIYLELNNKRIIIESILKKNPLLFSKNSPYAQALQNLAGIYTFKFCLEKETFELILKIQKYHNNIKSLNDSIIIENDQISVLNKGQIINLNFSISGLFFIQTVTIYLKVLEVFIDKKEIKGNFNGVDINNNLISGNVFISSASNE